MKLTNYTRDAIIRAIMQDVPAPNVQKRHAEAYKLYVELDKMFGGK